jgi:hypothetical protein
LVDCPKIFLEGVAVVEPLEPGVVMEQELEEYLTSQQKMVEVVVEGVVRIEVYDPLMLEVAVEVEVKKQHLQIYWVAVVEVGLKIRWLVTYLEEVVEVEVKKMHWGVYLEVIVELEAKLKLKLQPRKTFEEAGVGEEGRQEEQTR